MDAKTGAMDEWLHTRLASLAVLLNHFTGDIFGVTQGGLASGATVCAVPNAPAAGTCGAVWARATSGVRINGIPDYFLLDKINRFGLCVCGRTGKGQKNNSEVAHY